MSRIDISNCLLISRLEAIYEKCTVSSAEDEASNFFDALDALVNLPDRFVNILGLIVKSPQNKKFVMCQAFESAIISMLGNNATYIFSRRCDGAYLASIVLPGMESEVTCESQTAALALLAALLYAIVSILEIKSVPKIQLLN
ncbi:MAG: hypothetical protein KGL44_09770 [Sphingomonadales bacterium]|nr:hypothetical protein [Sphingomonadales bacterium]